MFKFNASSAFLNLYDQKIALFSKINFYVDMILGTIPPLGLR